MPLIVEGGRIPPRWALEGTRRPVASADNRRVAEHLNLAFINNMPDAALEDTELQFFGLLDDASGDVPVYLRLYSLAGIPRGDRGLRHLNSFYYDLDELWKKQFDGVIITGTEPRQPNLKDEPYWRVLTDVFDWAERNTSSTVLSCLAAHASVLHGDGIQRYRLPDKRFGVFESERTRAHALLAGVPSSLHFPHSRWNEVRENELVAAGYLVLTKSRSAGVDLFVKKKKKSLFVHFQGHPEYGAQTLLKEYRRDIKRFLRGERETHPSKPHGYFDSSATKLLDRHRECALSDRREEIIESFPESVVSGLENGWKSSSVCVYRNWLNYVAAQKVASSGFASIARVEREAVQPVNNEVA
jgi:homoserine O-succinyltransferase/O-acetyltransferase